MGKPAPGFAKRPDHTIVLGQPTGRVSVRVDGVEIARTERAVRLEEHGYPPRWYLPRADIAPGVLVATQKTTYCPFKGTTTYYDVVAAGGRHAAVAWSYDEPYDEMAPIAGHVAFAGAGLETVPLTD